MKTFYPGFLRMTGTMPGAISLEVFVVKERFKNKRSWLVSPPLILFQILTL